MPVAQHDVAAPGDEVAPEEDPPEAERAAENEGAFSKRADVTVFGIDIWVRLTRGVPPFAEVQHREGHGDPSTEHFDDRPLTRAVGAQQGNDRALAAPSERPALGHRGKETFGCWPALAGGSGP